MRKLHTKRYQKQVPGHHIQVDVKFLTFRGKSGEKVRRFQYTAIDDATRVRALKVYEKHTQANAINFIDYISSKSSLSAFARCGPTTVTSFRPNSIGMSKISGSGTPTSNGALPQLNGKVERSHRSDQQEFYQLLSYKGDVDLEAKLDEWERFYNFARPHGAHNGQTPYEALRDKLQ